MQEFLDITFGFPLILLTLPLVVSFVYWAFALLGVFDIDVLDPDIDMDVDVDVDADAGDDLHGFGALLASLGLVGVPVTVSFTILFLIAWLIGFVAIKHIVFGFFSGVLITVVGLAALIVALLLGLVSTQRIVRLLRPLFKQHFAANKSDLVGIVGIIKTNHVTPVFGIGEFDDGGSGLLLQIRSAEPNDYKRGDKVVTLEYNKEEDTYQIAKYSDLDQ